MDGAVYIEYWLPLEFLVNGFGKFVIQVRGPQLIVRMVLIKVSQLDDGVIEVFALKLLVFDVVLLLTLRF